MWYSRRTMRIIFYLGAMVAIVGLGIYIMMDHSLAGTILVCIGVAAAVFGFGGLLFNAAVDRAHYAAKNGPEKPQQPQQ